MSLAEVVDRMLSNIGLPRELPADPMAILRRWYDEAMEAKRVPDPDAMVLATAGADGPSGRVVLCKKMEPAGCLVFFTNYTSRKGREALGSGRASAVFHWAHDGRQARVEGVVEKSPDAESDEYFASRPLLSRLGAWASHQSEPMSSRAQLISQVMEQATRFGVGVQHLVSAVPIQIPRPEHWGGIRLWAERVELWQSVQGRLHDRAEWRRAGRGAWGAGQRLQP